MIARIAPGKIALQPPSLGHAWMGIGLGIVGLVALAFMLNVVDPLLRDPTGTVFSFSKIERTGGQGLN